MSIELKIQPLRYVLAVREEGSFHGAALKLHRSQPALSMAIRDLEERLGQPLFEKTHKGQLTPFGEYCLPRFRELIKQHDRLANELQHMAKGHQGRVTLATVPSVASRLMPEFLAAFVAEHPDININLHDENAEFVCRLVASGEVDLGISSMWVQNESLTFTSLFEDNVGVVMRRDHPLANRDSLDWQELTEERFIANGTSRLLEHTAAASLVDNNDFFISNMISLRAMLEAGSGITTLPRLAFPVNNDRLCFVPLSEPKLVRQIGIIKQANRSLSPSAQALEKMIIERLAGMPVP
ncbi:MULTISPECIES: LysR family transcriptional regulator [Marinobacter]|jgi:DNA-binding transcriptional LysR family regulator|uniref:LysR family transcriptional regulator n=1 Tax=Marinobacter TaxID=2742 RepID=UPI00110836CA|nr:MULTISPECIES: LysR family transcriptional regulator [Marinobacter]MCK2148100.1 LysR family transcriptional regulator [Marinobacter alexandrii]